MSNRTISKDRAFFVTENFRQKPITLSVAKSNKIGYIVSSLLRLIGVK